MSNLAPRYIQDLPGQWLASLALVFSKTTQGSRLSAVKRRGPLGVQKPFYPEGPNCAHVYLLHPPAGIVSGDTLCLSVDVQDDAHSLLTTPGANRFYRARKNQDSALSLQHQHSVFTLSHKAILEHLPQETLIYDGANAINTVDVHLHKSSVYLGWDINCLGLQASNQPFISGQFSQLNRVYCDNKLIFHDRIRLDAASPMMNAEIGLAGRHVWATFIGYAPALFDRDVAQQLICDIRDYVANQRAEDYISVTLMNGLLVCRYLGQQSDSCKTWFTGIWNIVRPVCCEKDTVAPRIWLT